MTKGNNKEPRTDSAEYVKRKAFFDQLITVYGRKPVLEILQDESLQYTEVSVDRFPAHVREWVRAKTGRTSVPQIFFHSKYIGGNVELQALLEALLRN